MSYKNVTLYLVDKTAMANPIAGAVVKVMNQQGTNTFTLATSAGDGSIELLLPSDTVFQLRFFKSHVSFTNPQYIVATETGENVFDIQGEPFEPPFVTDPRLCVASGFFRRPDGAPAANVDMQFIAKFDPILLEGDALLTERVTIRTDKNGYAQISLIRCAQYDVTLQGFEDQNRIVNVPDLMTVNLPDLLFPVVAQIVFHPAPPFTVPVGQTVVVTPTVITSDGRVLEGTAVSDVNWSSSNPDVLKVAVAATTLELTGSLPGGSAFVQATRCDTSIIRIPNTPIIGVPAAVTVS